MKPKAANFDCNLQLSLFINNKQLWKYFKILQIKIFSRFNVYSQTLNIGSITSLPSLHPSHQFLIKYEELKLAYFVFYAEYCQYLKSMVKLGRNVLIFTTAFCYNLYPVLRSNLYEHVVFSTQSAFHCSLLKYTCLLVAMRQMISIRKKMLLSSIQISINWLHL